MLVEIADIGSSTTFKIDSESVIGRDGAENDIPIADPKVSGRHARVFQQNGKWFIEDLGSSNGTFVKGEKINEPVELAAGMHFSLCEHTFGVVAVQSSDEPTAMLDASAMIGEDPTTFDPRPDFADEATAIETSGIALKLTGPVEGQVPVPELDHFPREEVAMPVGAVPDEVPHRWPTTRNPLPPTEPDKRPEISEGKRRRPMSRSHPSPTADLIQPLLPYWLKTMPKALGFYLGAVPVMLFNPIGTVKKSIRAQPFEPFAPRTLVAYTLPALWLGAAAAFLVPVGHAMIRGTLTITTVLTPIMVSAAMVLVAVAIGYAWHPGVRRLVTLLKGKSDNVSRTNFFVNISATAPLQFLAAGVAALVVVIPLPFGAVLPPLFALFTTLILFYVTYAWLKAFGVAPWVPWAMLLLMALGMTGVGIGLIGVVRTEIAQLGAASSLAKAGVQVEGADEPQVETVALVGAMAAREVDAQIAELEAKGELTPEIEKALRGQAAGTDSSVVEIPPDASLGDGIIKSRYPEYKRRRKEIEAAIKKDPTLISKTGIKPLYVQLTAETIRIRQKHKIKLPKRPTPEQLAKAKIQALERDSDVYEHTVVIVDRLYGLVFLAEGAD